SLPGDNHGVSECQKGEKNKAGKECLRAIYFHDLPFFSSNLPILASGGRIISKKIKKIFFYHLLF
ncbi:MAG: hypothetical protein IJC73_08585, partial [Lentisphaeria bacterium]|nr:hypothetical protein [Lentisphaeria bacterium]